MEKLLPNNNNGDAIALGSIALAIAVLITTIRLGSDWSSVVDFIYTAIAAAFVLGLGYLSAVNGRPEWYQTAIYVAGFGIAVIAVINLADVLGANGPSAAFSNGLAAGTRVWVLAVLIGIAGYMALVRNSGVMTLFSALLIVGLILSLVEWIFTPDKPLETHRWLLAVIVFVYIAIALLDIVPDKFRQVAVVDAAGFALLALSFTFVVSGGAGTSAGWEIIIGLGSLALIAYALVDGDPGPGYLGGFNLIAFGVIAAATDDPSLVWWPLILLVIAVAAFGAAYTGQRVPKLSEARSLKR